MLKFKMWCVKLTPTIVAEAMAWMDGHMFQLTQ